MKNQKYAVELSVQERKAIENFKRSKKCTEQCKTHANVILCLDENSQKPMTPEQAAKLCKLHVENVYKIRKQYVTEGLDRVLNRKKRATPPVPGKITGDVEAHIVATACSDAPNGRKSWTLKMIAEKIVLDGLVDSISDVSVMHVLKKHNLSLT